MPGSNGTQENFATAVTEVSERVTVLIREEVELAKAEVTQKVSSLARGTVAVLLGAVFGVFALIFLLETAAWGLNAILIDGAGDLWIGFAIVFGVLALLTIVVFLFAWRKLRAIVSFIVDSYRRDPDLMKVIIVEVTRAANTFGQTHLAKIREAYDLIEAIVAGAQRTGEFKDAVSPRFAAMAFYGAIEQVLTGWIFESDSVGEDELERAKALIVETICRGLEG